MNVLSMRQCSGIAKGGVKVGLNAPNSEKYTKNPEKRGKK